MAVASAASQENTIGSGDVVEVNVWQQTALSRTYLEPLIEARAANCRPIPSTAWVVWLSTAAPT